MKYQISISIMVYFILLIILILNMEDKSKIIKNSFLVFIMVLFTALFFVNELVMDYIISQIIRYIYYPTFASIIATLVFMMIILVSNVYDDKKKDKIRIINYTFSCFIIIAFVIFSFLKIDINSYNALYTGDSLICLRYISRTFILWLVITAFIKYFSLFVQPCPSGSPAAAR